MSNLKNLRCYFSYPIEYSNQENELSEAKKKLSDFFNQTSVTLIDPKNISSKGISEIDLTILRDRHNYEEVRRIMKAIVRKDLRAVDLSDFIVAFLPVQIKTTGTTHEIIQADDQKKPTLLICPSGIQDIPAWFFGIIPLEYMFSSVEDAIEYLKSIDSIDLNEIRDDRWQFIIQSLRS